MKIIPDSLAIMQPYFFPYLGYFHLMNSVENFVFYDDVNYINKGYINRNCILLNGKSHRITLPLSGASQNKLIKEINICENSFKILKTLEMSYKRAPFFNDVFDIISKVFLFEEKNLARFIGNSLAMVANYLKISANFIYSSEIKKDTSLKAQNKILEICKILNARNYINAIGGKKLYDQAIFENENINLFFVNSHFQKYKQFKNNFIPFLSIIDILMFNDKDTITNMLNDFDLI